MRRVSMLWTFVALISLPIALQSRVLFAGDWGWLNVTHLWKGTPVDVHRVESCEQCGHEGCIERTPVEECVVGKKEVFKTCVRYEYVSIPEVRYRWQIMCIKKEIPCDTCKTVCEDQECIHPYQVSIGTSNRPLAANFTAKPAKPRPRSLRRRRARKSQARPSSRRTISVA